MRGGLKKPPCCPKKELEQGSGCEEACSHLLVAPKRSLSKVSLDAGRPAQLLVLRAPLSLPGHLVQPGLEALAHPPEHAGE